MEVLHAFSIDWKILVIQLFNFALILWVLRRFLYRPVMRMIDERSARIAQGLKDADDARVAKEKVAAQKDDIILAARAEGAAIVESLRKDALEKERKLSHEAEERRTALMMDAKKNAEEERDHVLRESEKEVARLAVLAAEKILRERAAA